MFFHAPVIILGALFCITFSFRRVVGGAEENMGMQSVVGDTFHAWSFCVVYRGVDANLSMVKQSFGDC